MSEYNIDESGHELVAHGEADFPCAAYSTSIEGFPWHWHDEFEALYALTGRVIIAAGSERILLSPGDAALVNSGVPHSVMVYNDEYYEECDVVFHPRFLYGSADSVLWTNYLSAFTQSPDIPGVALRGNNENQKSAAESLKRACEYMASRPPMYEFYVRSELTRVFTAAYALMADKLALKGGADARVSERVKKMMSYMSDNIENDVSLAHLAEQAHVSPRECQREFKEYLGMTPFQYLSQLRLTQAAKLLTEGQSSITEICFLCGFQDPSNFTRQFRARYGVPPREYKARAR